MVIFIISLLILVHEAGHFLSAKACGVSIATFSIGLGPKLWGVQYGETEYRLSLIPLGGYVLPAIEDEQEFFNIPIHKRVIFTLGGPIANIMAAILLLSVQNTVISGWSFYGGMIAPFWQSSNLLVQFVQALPGLFVQPEQLSGIVGIVAIGGQIVERDYTQLLWLAIVLNINLAVFNLLPLPPLDGGKLLLYGLEKINTRLVKLHLPVTVAGWVLLLGLMIYATIGDIGNLII